MSSRQLTISGLCHHIHPTSIGCGDTNPAIPKMGAAVSRKFVWDQSNSTMVRLLARGGSNEIALGGRQL